MNDCETVGWSDMYEEENGVMDNVEGVRALYQPIYVCLVIMNLSRFIFDITPN